MPDVLDYRGLKCPQPVLKLSLKAPTIPAGTVITVQADCPEFESDIKSWCKKTGKVLINIVDKGAYKEASVRC